MIWFTSDDHKVFVEMLKPADPSFSSEFGWGQLSTTHFQARHMAEDSLEGLTNVVDLLVKVA